ncbi:MAG: hypothetical protein O3A85_13700 [Proteobacteria bacterium]|nr:hypothetical protein [Pseudomonadota bacterium]
MRVAFTLLLISIGAMILYLVLLILYPDQFPAKDWIGATADKKIYSGAENPAWARGFELGGRYGQPAGSDCIAAEKEISIQCNQFWMLTGVRLTAEIKTSVSEGGGSAQTRLIVTATELRPDSLFQTLGNNKKTNNNLNLRDLEFQK